MILEGAGKQASMDDSYVGWMNWDNDRKIVMMMTTIIKVNIYRIFYYKPGTVIRFLFIVSYKTHYWPIQKIIFLPVFR